MGTTPVAQADLISVYFKLQAGGGSGVGLFGEEQDNSKYANTSGLGYGFIVGTELLFVDLWVDHQQYLGRGGFRGTWTKFMLGFDTEIGFGDKRGETVDEEGRSTGGYHTTYFEFGGGVGLGVGTADQIDPPLNNSQLDDKGFVGQFRVGAGYHLNKYMSLGAVIPVEFGFLFKEGPANLEENRYGALGYGVLAQLSFHFTK